MRENRVYCEVHRCDVDLEVVRALDPIGVILSGGPGSVYEQEAPQAAAAPDWASCSCLRARLTWALAIR